MWLMWGGGAREGRLFGWQGKERRAQKFLHLEGEIVTAAAASASSRFECKWGRQISLPTVERAGEGEKKE